MQVNNTTNNVLTGPDILRQSGTEKSSQFQKLLQKNITPTGNNIPGMNSPDDNLTQQRVCLGTIDAELPTVSHLLYASSHKNECWTILDREVNADKPFTRIPSGTPIYMDTRTSEIIWESSSPESMGTPPKKNVAQEVKLQPDPSVSGVSIEPERQSNPAHPFSKKISDGTERFPSPLPGPVVNASNGLDQAVGAFIGTPYSRMNCYELLVEGLESMGVQYGGKDGLSRHLMDQASREGRSSYSLHSGEGLSQAIGSDVFMESIPQVKSVNSQTREVMSKMTDVLKEGQILSFSTPTRGHTGVISKKAGEWTFINSGVMDHNLAGKNGGRAVGEEGLDEEIKNWFQRAQKEGSGLTITLGAVDTAKLAQFQQPTLVSLSQRV